MIFLLLQKSILLAACILFILTTLNAEKRMLHFQYSDCTPDKSHEVLSLQDLHIKPDPVQIPGNLTAWGYFRVNEPIIGNISLEVKLHRYLGFFWLPIPCIKNVGSCTYHDICQRLLDQYNDTAGCKQVLKAHGIPCICPFLPGTYTLQPEIFQIHKLKGLLISLATGDYKVDLRLKDTQNNVIACQHLELSLTKGVIPTEAPTEKPKCSNILDCLLG